MVRARRSSLPAQLLRLCRRIGLIGEAAFHAGLDDIKTYLAGSLAAPALSFKSADLVAILDSFAPVFHAHLVQEPRRLAALSAYDFDMKTLGDHTTQHALQRYSTTDVLPMLWYNVDTAFEDGKWADFPPLPAPVKWYMVNVLGWWRRGWWRFGSCGADGRERELVCLKDGY
jgi:hypothetical protein